MSYNILWALKFNTHHFAIWICWRSQRGPSMPSQVLQRPPKFIDEMRSCIPSCLAVHRKFHSVPHWLHFTLLHFTRDAINIHIITTFTGYISALLMKSFDLFQSAIYEFDQRKTRAKNARSFNEYVSRCNKFRHVRNARELRVACKELWTIKRFWRNRMYE